MDTLTKSLDLQSELDDQHARLEQVEADIDEKVDTALDLEADAKDDDVELDVDVDAELRRLEAEVTQLEATLVAVRGYAEALERAVDEWDGTEVIIRELTGAEVRLVKSEAQQKADQHGLDYTDDIHETLFLQKAVQSTPPGAPEPSAIGDLPNRLFEWLNSRANTLNSTGSFDMGNSSLRERMMDRRETDSTSASS